MEDIKSFFVENNCNDEETISVTQSLFKKTVMKAIKEQGYSVKNNKKEKSEIVIKGSKPITDIKRIITNTLEQVIDAENLSKAKNDNTKNSESKQQPIYQNLQDIKITSEEPIYQNIEEMSSPPPLPPKPQRPHAAASHESTGKNKEENICTKSISLAEEFKNIKSEFEGCKPTKINATLSAFKEIVIKNIEKQGYSIENKQGISKIIIHSSKPIGIDIKKVKTDIASAALEQIKRLKEEIKSLDGKHDEIKREILKLLEAQRPHAAASPNSIGKNKEEDVHTKKSTISLVEGFKTIKSFFADCGQSIINAICNVFKQIVMTRIKEQGHSVSSKREDSEVIIHSNKPIDIEKIKTDAIDASLIQIMELDEEKIKNLDDNHKNVELKQEISKLLKAKSQEKDVNSNYMSQDQLNERQHSTAENNVERLLQSRSEENKAVGRC